MAQAKIINSGKRKRKFDREGFYFFLFIIPVLAYVFIFRYKSLWGWLYAFTDYKPGLVLEKCNYVGFKNFGRMFVNAAYRSQVIQVMVNTLSMAFIGIALGPLTIIFAIFLNEMNSMRCRKLVQTFTTLPHFISIVTLYSIVYYMLSNGGFVNTVMVNMGLIEKPIDYLASPDNTYLKMWAYGTWKGIGWSAIIYLAAIAGIDQELYEAAMIDGAGRFRRIWHVTVPGIIPTYFVLLIMGFGNLINTGYEMQYVFQNAMNKKYIEVLDLYVFNQGIGQGNVPFATAVGILKSGVALILFTFANTLSKVVRGSSIF